MVFIINYNLDNTTVTVKYGNTYNRAVMWCDAVEQLDDHDINMLEHAIDKSEHNDIYINVIREESAKLKVGESITITMRKILTPFGINIHSLISKISNIHIDYIGYHLVTDLIQITEAYEGRRPNANKIMIVLIGLNDGYYAIPVLLDRVGALYEHEWINIDPFNNNAREKIEHISKSKRVVGEVFKADDDTIDIECVKYYGG